MPRQIDHLVLPATTLTLARSQLTGLGFTVAPDARHPFGTGNCCVLFKDRSYLEPITIVDRAAADRAAAEGQFFVRRVKRFTERVGEGFAMAAFTSEDAEQDREEFERRGLSAGPVFRFSRPATAPDGSATEIGVALACLDDKAAPDATFVACQHFARDALFQPAFLEHANGAEGVAAVAAVASVPEQYRAFLSAAAGISELRESEAGLEGRLDGQSVLILTPAGFRDRYGLDAPDPRRGLLLAGIELGVADIDRAVGHAGPNAKRHEALIVIPPAPGLAAVLAFRTGLDG